MITLTAKIYIDTINPSPFIIGKSVVGGSDLIGSYIKVEKDFSLNNLISLERAIFDRSDTKLPSYGILSNNGNLEFNDTNGAFLAYANAGVLVSGLKVHILLNNTLSKSSEQVGVFETDTWDYDNNNRSVLVSLKDDLEEWQDIQVDGFGYDPINRFKVIADGKMSNVYKWLQSQDENGNYRTPKKYQMLPFDELDEKTKSILENTTIDYPLLENGTLWEQWTKLCQVCGLYIYKNNEGKTVCTYAYGS
jgi:hypothetical protein